MSWRICIDTTGVRDVAHDPVYESVVTTADSLNDALDRWQWHLPQKLFCMTLDDAAIVIALVEKRNAADAGTMTPDDYRLFVDLPDAARSVELPGTTIEEWRRDLTDLQRRMRR